MSPNESTLDSQEGNPPEENLASAQPEGKPSDAETESTPSRPEATLSEMAAFIRGKVQEFRGLVESAITRSGQPGYHAAKDRLHDTDKFLEKVVTQLQLGEASERAEAAAKAPKAED